MTGLGYQDGYVNGFAAAIAAVLQYHERRRAELWDIAPANAMAGAHAAAHGESIGVIKEMKPTPTVED